MRHRQRRGRLSRRLVATATIGAALIALAGCGKPAGVDGVLTDDWPAISAPTGFTPVAGACHEAGFSAVGFRTTYETVDCAERHRTETVHVGRFTGTVAAAAAPPASGSPGARTAYRECDIRATGYVGANWRTARLWLGVVQPSPAAWSGGAKWFRCDLIEVSSVEDDGDLVPREGSLRNVLDQPDSPLRLGCYGITLDDEGGIDTMPPAGCTRPHNAEFVGVWTAPNLPYPKDAATWEKFHDGCRSLIAKYVGVPDDENLEFRTGVVSLPGGEDVWSAGDRGVRCYLWVDGRKLTRSLKGGGAKALPVQYE